MRIKPRITSEERPPEVTTPRKIRSVSLGLVVISRFAGTAGGVWVRVEVTEEYSTL
jgi:hypothetical protein